MAPVLYVNVRSRGTSARVLCAHVYSTVHTSQVLKFGLSGNERPCLYFDPVRKLPHREVQYSSTVASCQAFQCKCYAFSGID